jgi:hypothetical protein
MYVDCLFCVLCQNITFRIHKPKVHCTKKVQLLIKFHSCSVNHSHSAELTWFLKRNRLAANERIRQLRVKRSWKLAAAAETDLFITFSLRFDPCMQHIKRVGWMTVDFFQLRFNWTTYAAVRFMGSESPAVSKIWRVMSVISTCCMDNIGDDVPSPSRWLSAKIYGDFIYIYSYWK